jgi:hypothetical protein
MGQVTKAFVIRVFNTVSNQYEPDPIYIETDLAMATKLAYQTARCIYPSFLAYSMMGVYSTTRFRVHILERKLDGEQVLISIINVPPVEV